MRQTAPPSRQRPTTSTRQRLVLRDGTVATVRARRAPAIATPSRRFFHDLSPESRRQRFFAVGEPPER